MFLYLPKWREYNGKSTGIDTAESLRQTIEEEAGCDVKIRELAFKRVSLVVIMHASFPVLHNTPWSIRT